MNLRLLPSSQPTRTIPRQTVARWLGLALAFAWLIANSSATAVLAALPAPALIEPGEILAPGPLVENSIPTFRWATVPGATGYAISIYEQLSGSLVYSNDNLPNVTEFTPEVGTLSYQTAYRWNVRAKDSTGNFGTPSTDLYFQTPEFFGAVALLSNDPTIPGTAGTTSVTLTIVSLPALWSVTMVGYDSWLHPKDAGQSGGAWVLPVDYDMNPGALRTGFFFISARTSDGWVLTISGLITQEAGSAGVISFKSTSYSVSENAGSVHVTVSRMGGVVGPASVSYDSSDGTATAGADYTAVSGTLNWGDGDAADKSFDVPIINDAAYEGDESFSIALSAVTGASLGNSSATVSIVDDDTLVTVEATDNYGSEAVESPEDPAEFTFRRSGAISGPLTVNFATSGTATVDADYLSIGNTVTFAPGAATAKAVVHVVVDNKVEDVETLNVSLLPGAGYVVGAPSHAIVTIGDSKYGLLNGGFEAYYSYWWTADNVRFETSGFYQPSQGAVLAAFNGGQAAPVGAIAQAFGTNPGRAYQLTFSVGILAYNNNEQRLDAIVEGNTTLLSKTISLFGDGTGVSRWTSRSFTFIADSDTTILTLRDASPTTANLDLLLDDVHVSVLNVPLITAQPASTAVVAGGTAIFTVTATGPGQLTYQWQRNGTPIDGATANMYTVSNVQAAQSGSYTVVVSAGGASVTSDPATLTVLQPGGLLNGSFESGFTSWTTSGNLGLESGAPYQASDGTTLVAFNGGQKTPNGVLAQTFSTLPGQGYAITFAAGVLAFNGNSQSLQVTVQGTGTLLSRTITLTGDGTGISRWSAQSFNVVADSSSTTLTFRDLSTATGNLDLLLDDVRVTAQNSLVITAQPADVSTATGGSAVFSVTATGPGSLTYQWKKDGNAVNGATASTFTINNVQTSDAGTYTVVMSNGTDSVTSNGATLTVLTSSGLVNGSFESGLSGWTAAGNLGLESTAPYQASDGATLVAFNGGQKAPNGVLSQTFPTVPGLAYTLTFAAGTLAYATSAQTLQVTAQGNSSLLSQSITFTGDGTGVTRWSSRSFNFTADSASTTLTFRDLSAATANLDLVLDDVRVTPQNTISISTQPAAQSVVVGGSATFNVVATGPGTLTYQWQRNGNPINGATASSYTINDVQSSQAGNYTVVVANGTTSLTSDSAVLAVLTSAGLVNGSFESGLSGWAATGNLGLESGSPYQANDGTTLVAFNGGQKTPNGVLSQSFPTAPGQTYTVSFAVGVLAYNTSEQRLQVTVQGSATVLSQTVSVFGDGSGISRWSGKSFTFVADSANATLTFRDVSTATANLDLLLDKVQVTAQALGLAAWSSPSDGGRLTEPTSISIQRVGSGIGIIVKSGQAGLFRLERSLDLVAWTEFARIELEADKEFGVQDLSLDRPSACYRLIRIEENPSGQ